MARRKRANPFDERQRIVGRSESQIVVKSGSIDAPGHEACSEKRAHFRGKQKIGSGLGVVKRLDAHGIARDKKTVASCIPKREGEHAAEFQQTLFAPAGIGLEQNLGVGVADKCCARLLQLLADVAKVVQLAVVDDPVPGF